MMVLMGMTVNGAAKELNGGRRRRKQGGAMSEKIMVGIVKGDNGLGHSQMIP